MVANTRYLVVLGNMWCCNPAPHNSLGEVILKLLMAKLVTQDLTCLPSGLLGRKEKHLELSVTSMLDRLTNLGEGEVDFMMDNNQVESLVNNLVVTKAVVGVVILVNPFSVIEQMGNISDGKEDIVEDSKISARECMEGREDD